MGSHICGNRNIGSRLFAAADVASMQPTEVSSNGNAIDVNGGDDNKDSNPQRKKRSAVSKVVDTVIRRLRIFVLSLMLIFLNIESLVDKFKMVLFERLSRKKTPLNAFLMRVVSAF